VIARDRRDRKGKTLPLINADDTDWKYSRRGVAVIAVVEKNQPRINANQHESKNHLPQISQMSADQA